MGCFSEWGALRTAAPHSATLLLIATMSRRPLLARLALPVLALLGGLIAGPADAQSSFPQHEKHSCPGVFTTSGGMCKTDKPGWEGMINPNGMQSCPSGWTRSTYYCIRQTPAAKAAKADAGKTSAQPAAPSAPPDPDKTVHGKPVLKRVTKRDELDYCPTGYSTSRARPAECVTAYAEAPDSTPKQGSCPPGTTEEQGQFCSGPTTLTLQQMDGAYIIDFNALYQKRAARRLDTSDANRPALFAQADDAAKAAKTAQPAAATGDAAQPVAATAPASATQGDAAKAAVKELGKSLKGLFSR